MAVDVGVCGVPHDNDMRIVMWLSMTGLVMIWAGISSIDGRTDIHMMIDEGVPTGARYCDEMHKLFVHSRMQVVLFSS